MRDTFEKDGQTYYVVTDEAGNRIAYSVQDNGNVNYCCVDEKNNIKKSGSKEFKKLKLTAKDFEKDSRDSEMAVVSYMMSKAHEHMYKKVLDSRANIAELKEVYREWRPLDEVDNKSEKATKREDLKKAIRNNKTYHDRVLEFKRKEIQEEAKMKQEAAERRLNTMNVDAALEKMDEEIRFDAILSGEEEKIFSVASQAILELDENYDCDDKTFDAKIKEIQVRRRQAIMELPEDATPEMFLEKLKEIKARQDKNNLTPTENKAELQSKILEAKLKANDGR